jgi:hypothetical protein
MGITGLTIDDSSTAPSRSEFSTFLNDGVIDVTYRWLAVKPQDREDFIRESITTASNGLDIGGATIISVLREAGADGDTDGSTAWRDCRKIPASMQSRVVDTESLHFASKYNPVYAIDDNGGVNVYPIPDGTDDGFRAYYVNNSPAETDGTALDHASTGIKYFPNDKVYLVVIYASIKSLQSSLSTINISTFSLSASTPTAIPGNPSIAGGAVGDVTIASLPTAPTYTPPVITNAQDGNFGDDTNKDLSTLSGAAWTDLDYDFDNENMDPLKWFQVAGDFIQNEEDSELAQAQLQKIATYIQAYSTAMQNKLNAFNDANVEYQAGIQRNLAQAQISMQDAQKTADLALQGAIADYQNELQRISIDAQKYQALVAAEVQTYQQEMAEKNTEYQWMTARLQDLKQEYDTAFAIAAPRPAQ